MQGAADRAACGGNLYAHADVHDGLGGGRKARFHGENGVCAGILSDLQLLFSQNHAYLRLVGEHTGTRQNALFRVDYQVSLAHGVPGKRLSGAVSAVLRRG